MQRFTLRKVGTYVVMTFVGLTALYEWLLPCNPTPKSVMVPKESVHYVYDTDQKAYPYDRYMPLIFIGGVPRSGTTLMRAMLDAHPLVRCGEETRVVPRLLGMRSQWAKSPKESKRLQEAGLSDEVIDSALSAFILEVIAKHGDPAPRLCNKDPFTLKSSIYLNQLFPNAKFILMIRDGRAVVHSIVSRKVTISGFDLKSYRKCLEKWNSAMESMYYQCLRLGLDKCLPVYYEQLVLHPREWMEKILKFLVIPWNDAVLHHEEFINKPGGVSLSRTERSTDQVIKPVNLEALTKWVHAIPDDVRQDMPYIAPMLSKLGYDPNMYPPSYGDADQTVAENTIHIRNNDDYWRKKSQEIQNMKKVTRSFVYGRNASLDRGKVNEALGQDQPDTEQNGKARYGESVDRDSSKYEAEIDGLKPIQKAGNVDEGFDKINEPKQRTLDGNANMAAEDSER